MSRFGWAYVNSVITGAVANGPTNSVQFNSGSQVLSGSSNFTFNPTTNTLVVTGTISASAYQGITVTSTPAGSDKQIQFNSGSTLGASSNLTFDYATNTLFLTGTLRADTLIVSSSQILKSGSTIFGDDTADTHQFTGSIYNTTLVSGTTAQFTTITGSSIQTNGISLTGALLMSGTSGQAYISEVDYIDFDTTATAPAYKAGRLYHNTDFYDLSFYTPVTDVKVNLGQQLVLRVRNGTASTIAKGKLVHITGGIGDNPLINTASWENDNNSANTLGMVVKDIASGDDGYVMLNGLITNVNTNPAIFTAGQIIYLSSSGDYTPNVPVQPNHNVRIGEVVRAHASVGSIFINIDNGYEIDELHNVLITSASNGDLLTYNSSSALWTNTKSLSGSYTITGSLTATSTISGSTGLFGVVTSSAFSGGSFVGTTVSGTTAQFTTITGSTIISNLLRVSGTSENAIEVSSSSPAFKINQQGSGFAFIVEDQAGPDVSPFVIAANGDVGIGTSIPTEKLHVIGAIKSTTTISGTTGQFTTITGSTITGSTGLFTTITASEGFVSGGLTIGNYVQMLPVGNIAIPTNQTASYIYTSGSTNDLYFTQYQPGTSFTNTTRLRWLEGGLSTGLLHGGILSTVTGTTSFNLTSGSGIILNFNATTGSDPYPTITYVNWNNFVSQSLIYSASAPITYISIDSAGAISQTNTAFTAEQFKDRIVIGRVLHQSGAVTNGTIVTPTTAYAINSNTQDFFRAFGPLKVSGQVLAASGSTTLAITRSAGDSYVEGRNYSSNPNSPNYVLAADDPALTTTKIFYSWVSGSTTQIDTNGGVGYAELIPNKYNLNGTITTITPTPNKFTVQRVYWFPKSVTRSLYVYYGSTIYTSLADAVAAIADEANFTEGDNTKASAVYLGAVVLEADAANFTQTTKTKVVNGGLFRATSNGGGGGGTAATPGGSTTQIQYNDGGSFNGSANFTWNNPTNTLTLTGSFIMIGTGSLDIDGGFITGSTARFTTITGSNISASNQLQVAGTSFLNSNVNIGGNILGSAGFKANYATFSTNFTASSLSYFVGVSTTGSVVTASLNSATNYPAGQTLIFKDVGGNAGTNNIRIQPSGSQTIDGATSLIISSTSGSATLVSNGVDGFYIVGLT